MTVSKKFSQKEINEIIKQKYYLTYNQTLTVPEAKILEEAWTDSSYEDLANNLYMSVGSIRNIASKFWQKLSQIYNQKINKTNFRTVITQIILNESLDLDSEFFAEENEDTNLINRGKIMIIDDQVENLKILKMLLFKEGYQVRSAKTAKMALLSLQESLPDVILLDILMPVMDGYEVCKIIKKNHHTCDIPIIFISSLDEAIDKVKAFELGACDYITKPFEEVEVLARVSHQIKIQQQTSALKAEIEEHQNTIEMLYQSRSILASVLNNSAYGIAVLEAIRSPINAQIIDFKYLLVNPTYAQIFHIKQREFINFKDSNNGFSLDKLNCFNRFVEVVKSNQDYVEIFSYSEQKYQLRVTKLGDGVTLNIIAV
jgi:DNA-binding response OmpR family regulator